MPYLSGLLEGFNASREAHAKQTYEADAQSREREANLYKYLLSSRDPEIQSLALSGLFESVNPGKKARGLSGWMGEVQGSQTYPQIKALMDQQVPDEPPAQAFSPAQMGAPPQQGAAALPGSSLVDPKAPGQPMQGPPPPQASPTAGAGAGAGLTPPPTFDQAQGASGVPSMMNGQMTPPPQMPEVSKWKRRGTGVPTAEEIAESTEGAKQKAHLGAMMEALRSAQTPDERRLILGMGGAPSPMDSTANGTMMADPNDPETPIPTVRHRDGTVTLTDGTSIAGLGLVGWVKPSTAALKSTKVPDKASPTGWSRVYHNADGSEAYRATDTPFVPPPAFNGQATITDTTSDTGRAVVQTPRGGGAPRKVGDAPAPEGGFTDAQAEAVGFLDTVRRAIKTQEEPEVPRGPKRPMMPAQQDRVTKELTKGKFLTYAELVTATQKTKAKGAATTAPTAAPSMADRIRARLDNQNRPPAAPVAP